MTIQLKIRDALLVSEGIRELPALPVSCIKISYWLGRIQSSLQSYILEHNKRRDDVIRSYGTLDPATGNYNIPPGNFVAFQASIDSLLDTDIVVPYNRVKIMDLQVLIATNEPKISPETLYKLVKVLDGFDMDE